MRVLALAVLLAACENVSLQSGELVLVAPATPVEGHRYSSYRYPTWCGPACRCNVSVSSDCADDKDWTELPEPSSPYMDAKDIPTAPPSPTACGQ